MPKNAGIPAGMESDDENDSKSVASDDYESMDPVTYPKRHPTHKAFKTPAAAECRNGKGDFPSTSYPRSFKSYEQNSTRRHKIQMQTEKLIDSNDLMNVFESADCGEYVNLFIDQKITLPLFLRMSETDLDKIGVKEMGPRKKLSQMIYEIHRRPWHDDNLNLPTKEHVLSCADATQIICNVHARLACMESSLLYVRQRFLTDDDKGDDVYQLTDVDKENLGKFANETNDAVKAAEKFLTEIKSFAARVNTLKVDPRYAAVDKISAPKPKDNKRRRCRLCVSGVIFVAFAAVTVAVACKLCKQ